jgi:ankyrin repeat protein
LLGKGADIKSTANSETVHARLCGDPGLLLSLLDRGAEVNRANRDGERPLFWAAAAGHGRAAKLLLDRGAEINATDQRGNSALHGAVDGGHETAAWLLLNQGANPALRNAGNDTAVDIAQRRGYGEIVKLLQPR